MKACLPLIFALSVFELPCLSNCVHLCLCASMCAAWLINSSYCSFMNARSILKLYVRLMISALDTITLRSLLCRLVSPSSARMMWHGPSQKYNKPEARKFSLILNSSNSENIFLREYGIRCLADHEIGTHFVSSTMIDRFPSLWGPEEEGICEGYSLSLVQLTTRRTNQHFTICHGIQLISFFLQKIQTRLIHILLIVKY